MTYRVLCTDGFSKTGVEDLNASSLVEADFQDKLSHEELIKRIPDYDGLVVRSASEVTRDVIGAGARLKVIARAGVGTDNIDLKAATEKGILVVNAPAGNSISTAELAFAMIISLARHIPQAAKSMYEGKWEKKKFKGNELAYKTLGVIGLGRIGKELAKRARAFEMNVIGFDPYLSDERMKGLGITKATLDEIFTNADFISVHTPLTDETTNLISNNEFAQMKTTACIVNCARGGIVNEADLAEALRNGNIGGAALDVFTEEPYGNDLFNGLDNVILTPHLGASTSEAQEAVAKEAAAAVVQFFKEGISTRAVNLPTGGVDLEQYTRHLMLAEKLGSLASQLVHDKIDRITFTAPQNLPHILTLAALKGVLSHMVQNVTIVNAANVARDQGIGIAEEVTSEEPDFADTIGVRLHLEKQELNVWGALLPDGSTKVTNCAGYRVEIDPAGNLLFLQNLDQPGVIGHVSTLLGNAGVNIAEMQNVRHVKGKDALTIVRVDGDVPKKTFDEIAANENIKRARLVHL